MSRSILPGKMDNSNSFEIYKNSFDNKSLFCSTETMNENTFNLFRSMIREVNDIYEDWDIYAVEETSKDIYIKAIVLRFKEIVISNTQNNRHTIKDLFVYMPIILPVYNDRPYLKIAPLKGIRTTVTKKECISKYFHSHLPSGDISESIPIFADFCLGTGPLNSEIADFNSEQDISHFRNILFHIMAFVTHESLEGAPYKKIANIGKDSESGYSHYYRPNLAYYTISFFKRLVSHVDLELQFNYDKHNFEILDIERNRRKIIEFLVNLPDEVLYKSIKDMLLYKVVDNTFKSIYSVEQNLTPISDKVSTEFYIPFKGEKIFGKIINEEEREEENKEISSSSVQIFSKGLEDLYHLLNFFINEQLLEIKRKNNNLNEEE